MEDLDRLYQERPKNRLVRLSLFAMAALIVGTWIWGDFVETTGSDRLANVERFLHELRPYPLQDRSFDVSVALTWSGELMEEKGWEAMGTTLAISVAAIVLAGIWGTMLALPAARNITAGFTHDSPKLWWTLVVGAARLILIFLRAIPEYVWAFLLLALLGPTAWPAVLALALHNSGIIGKLSAEAIEDLSGEQMSSLTSIGASRLQTVLAAVAPAALPRLLLFFFYRWETCVREATVLGMLGIVSLGFWIQDARARNFYDEMFFLILLGAFIVMIGDVVSTLVRAYVRRAS
tara:strand:+ start:3169 stop:4044 length:876 start_codon:yes stop_codon:yes gene_type:complete